MKDEGEMAKRRDRSISPPENQSYLPPPPIPAMALATSKVFIEGAKPQPSVPSEKNETATIIEPFLPTISLSLPYTGLKAQTVNR